MLLSSFTFKTASSSFEKSSLQFKSIDFYCLGFTWAEDYVCYLLTKDFCRGSAS